MRITGGILKGRNVEVPPGIIRPSMDKMRESVFSILGDLNGLCFLDIFSGSGIIALEAASRGATYIEAVESDPLKRKILLKNVSISPVRINCRFISAELYIQRVKRPFNVIFLDPPFPYRFRWELMQKLSVSTAVSDETIIIIHRPRKDLQKEVIEYLKLKDSREFGNSTVDFYNFKNNS